MQILAEKETEKWANNIVKKEQIDRYLANGRDFIDEEDILERLLKNKNPDKARVRAIIGKAKEINTLGPDETAALLNVEEEELWEEMYQAGLEIKKKVYDNRIVFFAPLYMSSYCVNNCRYCGFRKDNKSEVRRRLSMEEIQSETEFMVNEGHKRMIAVYGEHPLSDIDYICDSIRHVYDVRKKAPSGKGYGNIRRVNINAAPMSVEKLEKLKRAGIGTFQVFQETYHRKVYEKMHPSGPKSDYRWRLYALHRAMEAGIDDVATGVLFGLHDWRFEVMGLLYHAIELERQFGIGPHTISFPRLRPASGSSVSTGSRHMVDDKDFKKLVAVLRLSVPYTGLIITAREDPQVREEVIKVGCTQTDASTRIDIGGYSGTRKKQKRNKQQFMLGDTRSLDEMIGSLAKMGMITSFCTAGYRCGRTGDKIMSLLKGCVEGRFCKLNAILTFKEYLEDYASESTKKLGEELIGQEMKEVGETPFFDQHGLVEKFKDYYRRIEEGERDLFI